MARLWRIRVPGRIVGQADAGSPTSRMAFAEGSVSSDVDILVTTLEHVTYPVSEPFEAELRTSVHAFVDARRDAGLPPERMIAELKELSRVALRRRRASQGRSLDEEGSARDLLEQIVRWAIERYYAR